MSIVLKAEKREHLGSSAAKKIRKSGLIPAIIYSKKGNVNLSLDGRQFERKYFEGDALATIMEVEFDGKKSKVIAHKIELDPVTDCPIHVDFFDCEESKTIRAKPRLVFVNQEKSPGIKKSGFLHVVLRRVEVICDSGETIPEKIEVDVGSLHIGNKIRAKDLKLPTGVKLAAKDDFLIGSLIGRGKSEEEQAAAATSEAAPATGTTAPAAGAAPQATAKTEEKKPAAKK